MSVENRQIDWGQCPIGKKCEINIDIMDKTHSKIDKKIDKLFDQNDEIKIAVTTLKTKVAIWGSIFFIIFTVLVSSFLDDIKDILIKHSG